MASDTREANDREMLVNLAIFDYHAAIDRGESLEPADWVAHHPDIAVELQAYFDDLATLHLLPLHAPDDLSETTSHPGAPGAYERRARLHIADIEPGDVLGDYVLLAKLGEGGQGVVWKARSRQEAEIVVALKTLRGPSSSSTASVERLRQDARAIARMKHPNIIGTSYFGEDGGRWFFVMDLVEGGTVEDRLAAYQADPRSAALLIEKIARAIHHAHTRSRGVLHLDLKPGNILLTADGEPKVTDFGLSVRSGTIDPSEEGAAFEHPGGPNRASDLSVNFTRAGIVGTLPFMSPEMAAGRGSDVSTASDVYGLGAILYAMLTGRAPFRGRDARETLSLVIRGNLSGPRELNRRVDRELNAVCLKCLNREPTRRYGSADALANDLRRWLERRPTLAGGKPSATREVQFWVRRHPIRFALAVLLVVALWLAGLAVAVAELRVENRRAAARLAGQVDRELRLIRRATQILASDARLRSAFASFPEPDQSGLRQRAIETFLKAAVERENLFGIAGGNPFVNVLVMGADGVLLADTLADSPAVGKDYHVRDYYRAFFENHWPRDYVYVARSFLSIKDGRYKIAVSTRISGDRGELLGVLVANFTIGPRLIDVDMRQEPNDAAVLCPMDRSDPQRGIEDPGPPWSYIFVLDRRYTVEWKDRPFEMDPSRLPDFGGNPMLVEASGGLEGGRFVDYHRVGESHLIVVMSRNGPWPLSWLSNFR
jgi:serine/threonine-protein kinase